MDIFHVIEDGVVILRSKGVYRQVAIYRRGHDVYAPHGGGFIKLLGRSGTTIPNISWDAIEGPGVHMSAHGSPPSYGARPAKAA